MLKRFAEAFDLCDSRFQIGDRDESVREIEDQLVSRSYARVMRRASPHYAHVAETPLAGVGGDADDDGVVGDVDFETGQPQRRTNRKDGRLYVFSGGSTSKKQGADAQGNLRCIRDVGNLVLATGTSPGIDGPRWRSNYRDRGGLTSPQRLFPALGVGDRIRLLGHEASISPTANVG